MLKKMSGGAYPITPSNASPVALTAGEAYDITSSGYAIASYTDVTPTDLPATQVYEGDIVRIANNNGVIVYGIETVVPDDVAPQQLSMPYNYRVSGSDDGYLVKSYPTAVTPSDTPQSVSSSGLYKFTSSGKVVDAIIYRAPSDSNPPALSPNTCYKVNSQNAGFLYASGSPATIKYAYKDNPVTYTLPHDLVKWYIFINMFNGANQTYLNNFTILIKPTNAAEQEYTAWKGKTPITLGQGSATATTGYGMWMYEIDDKWLYTGDIIRLLTSSTNAKASIMMVH
jgi:hypothetical protein